MGFLGKSCIHPSQIALANEVFRPSDEEIAHAVRVAEAAGDAESKGVGAYVVDGRMIDPPFVERARVLVGTALRLGLLTDEQRAALARANVAI
jgi:citrate lyase subunit beta/citryl-CoA lyase